MALASAQPASVDLSETTSAVRLLCGAFKVTAVAQGARGHLASLQLQRSVCQTPFVPLDPVIIRVDTSHSVSLLLFWARHKHRRRRWEVSSLCKRRGSTDGMFYKSRPLVKEVKLYLSNFREICHKISMWLSGDATVDLI